MMLHPRFPIALLAVALGAALSLAACKKAPPPPPPAPPAPVVPPPPPPPASASGISNPECVGPFTADGEATEFKVGAHTFKRQGATLSVTDPDGDDQVVFGVIANLKEGTGENFYNLKRYLEFFQAEKAEAILVAGDSGETRDGVAQVLEPLAKSGLPTFVIPGNREARADFRAAIAELATKYPNVIDMSKTRLVKFDDASIVSLPGYYDKRFIHVGDAGCQYFKQDVEALGPIVAAAAQPVILLSHAEPNGHGNEAIDAFGDGNAGDANLTAFLRSHPVPFGIAANIHEAGGRATDIDSNVVREGEGKPHVYLNPGLADSTPWKLNDGTWSYGMVATMTVKGKLASFKTFRAKQLTDAEQAEARKLEPTAAAGP